MLDKNFNAILHKHQVLFEIDLWSKCRRRRCRNEHEREKNYNKLKFTELLKYHTPYD